MSIRLIKASRLRELEVFVEDAESSSHCVGCPWLEGKKEHHPSYEITDKCNLNCIFCYAYSTKIAGKLPKPGYYGDINPKAITISQYGEPLMAGFDKVEKIISALKSKFKARIDLQTNGTLLTGNIGADIVMISLDAASRENYIRITGRDMFLNVLNAIGIVSDCCVGIVRTVYLPGINDRELKDISKIAFDSGVEFMLQPCSIHPNLENRLKEAGYDFEKDTLYDYLDYSEMCDAKIPACLVEIIKSMLEVMDFEEIAFIKRIPSKKPPEIARKWRFVLDV